MKDYTPKQILIMKIGLQLAQLSGYMEMELAMQGGLNLAWWQAIYREQEQAGRAGA